MGVSGGDKVVKRRGGEKGKGVAEEEGIDGPSDDDGDGCSTLCNIIIKFTLFLANFIIWVRDLIILLVIISIVSTSLSWSGPYPNQMDAYEIVCIIFFVCMCYSY